MTEPPSGPHILTLCTGNAARSVMAGYMLQYLSDTHGLDLVITTAGTHTIDGHPMSMRTRKALTSIPELADAPVARHRSRQLHGDDLHDVDLVVAMEADHVRYVRRHHLVAAERTATLRRLCETLEPGPAPLAERIAALHLGEVTVDDHEDVADPAGREDPVYVACANELWDLCRQLVKLLPGSGGG